MYPRRKSVCGNQLPPGVLFAVYETQTGQPEYIPPEYTDIPMLLDELIQSRQKEYYEALGTADMQMDSAGFVELILEIIRDSLREITVVGNSSDQDSDQVSDQDEISVKRL